MKASTPIEQVKIADVQLGKRRRKTLGGLAGLKRSIETHGLLHPIILRNGNELVAGARRLESCRQLGWDKIAARRVEKMSDEELRAIELDENEQRLALADYESSKARLAEIRQAEAEARAEISAPSVKNPKGGRPKKSTSRKRIAEKTGVSATGQRKIERHVEIAEQFPFMQGPGWKQYTVLEAGEAMEQIPKREHPAIASLLDQPGVPPKSAIKILRNLGSMEKDQREAIYLSATNDDIEERKNALALAAALPKEPHGCLLRLKDVCRELGRCKRGHRALVDEIEKLIDKMKEELADGE